MTSVTLSTDLWKSSAVIIIGSDSLQEVNKSPVNRSTKVNLSSFIIIIILLIDILENYHYLW